MAEKKSSWQDSVKKQRSNFQMFFSRFGFVINLCAAGLLLSTLLSAGIPPDTFWPAAFLSLGYPYILLLNVAFVIYYLLRKSPKFLVSFLIILFGYKDLARHFQLFPTFKQSSTGLKVLSYNVHHFRYDLKKNKDNPEILNYLREQDADIICLQETHLLKSGKLKPSAIRDALPKIKHYQLAHSIYYAGPITLSRYPIITLGEIRFEKSANMVTFSDIVLPGNDTIRVYNCHLQSYSITPEEYSIIDPKKQAGSNEQQLMEARIIFNKMKIAFEIRARQAREVAVHIRQCRYPVIVCGDFNDTPCSYTYRILSNSLKDAFIESGFGYSNTYNGLLPAMRIDYILYSDRFTSVQYSKDRVDFSDHFPISAVLTDRKKQN